MALRTDSTSRLGPNARATTRGDDGEVRAVDVPRPELVLRVRRIMRSITGPSSELEDLTQTALERVVRGIERFEGRAELETYLYRVCVRVALNHWRGWRRWFARFDLGTDHASDPPDPAGDPAALLAREARAARLRSVLAHLDPLARVVVTLIDLEELAPARVAEILECPEPTVRSRLRRGRIDLEARILRDPWFREEVER